MIQFLLTDIDILKYSNLGEIKFYGTWGESITFPKNHTLLIFFDALVNVGVRAIYWYGGTSGISQVIYENTKNVLTSIQFDSNTGKVKITAKVGGMFTVLSM